MEKEQNNYWFVRQGVLYKMKTLDTTEKYVELSVEFKNGKVKTKKIWFKNFGQKVYTHSWDLGGDIYMDRKSALNGIIDDASRDIESLKNRFEREIKRIENRVKAAQLVK